MTKLFSTDSAHDPDKSVISELVTKVNDAKEASTDSYHATKQDDGSIHVLDKTNNEITKLTTDVEDPEKVHAVGVDQVKMESEVDMYSVEEPSGMLDIPDSTHSSTTMYSAAEKMSHGHARHHHHLAIPDQLKEKELYLAHLVAEEKAGKKVVGKYHIPVASYIKQLQEVIEKFKTRHATKLHSESLGTSVADSNDKVAKELSDFKTELAACTDDAKKVELEGKIKAINDSLVKMHSDESPTQLSVAGKPVKDITQDGDKYVVTHDDDSTTTIDKDHPDHGVVKTHCDTKMHSSHTTHHDHKHDLKIEEDILDHLKRMMKENPKMVLGKNHTSIEDAIKHKESLIQSITKMHSDIQSSDAPVVDNAATTSGDKVETKLECVEGTKCTIGTNNCEVVNPKPNEDGKIQIRYLDGDKSGQTEYVAQGDCTWTPVSTESTTGKVVDKFLGAEPEPKSKPNQVAKGVKMHSDTTFKKNTGSHTVDSYL